MNKLHVHVFNKLHKKCKEEQGTWKFVQCKKETINYYYLSLYSGSNKN
jgi:hypothetical protein